MIRASWVLSLHHRDLGDVAGRAQGCLRSPAHDEELQYSKPSLVVACCRSSACVSCGASLAGRRSENREWPLRSPVYFALFVKHKLAAASAAWCWCWRPRSSKVEGRVRLHAGVPQQQPRTAEGNCQHDAKRNQTEATASSSPSTPTHSAPCAAGRCAPASSTRSRSGATTPPPRPTARSTPRCCRAAHHERHVGRHQLALSQDWPDAREAQAVLRHRQRRHAGRARSYAAVQQDARPGCHCGAGAGRPHCRPQRVGRRIPRRPGRLPRRRANRRCG